MLELAFQVLPAKAFHGAPREILRYAQNDRADMKNPLFSSADYRSRLFLIDAPTKPDKILESAGAARRILPAELRRPPDDATVA